MGNGAGLWVLGAADCVLTLEGNTIAKNEAGQRGGGMKLNMDKNSQVNLISGLISENRSSGFGGGIDYTNHENPTLHLTNVLITGNRASRGAGIWACPTSETEVYSTLGGAFYGNKATGKTGGISILMKHQEMRSAMKEPIHRISSRFRATRRAQLPTFLFPVVLWAAV